MVHRWLAGGIAAFVALISLPAAAAARDQLGYDGGPVLVHPSATYLIYWRGTSGTLPASYVSDLSRFVTDWSGTTAHGVLTQYYQRVAGTEHVSNRISLGGMTTDPTPFPAKHNILTEAQLRAEILSVVRSNGWPEGYTANYAVLLPEQARTRHGGCAWHDWAADTRTGGKVFYSVVPYWKQPSTGCPMPRGPYPHSREIDNAIDLLSHELAEIATNPWHLHSDGSPRSWFTKSGDEVGDLCRFVYGPRDQRTGADVYLHGDPYLIQGEWSNADHGCSLGPTLGRAWSPSQEGYGLVKPSTIFNGGDPTGLVQRVTWNNWGQPRAIGHGTGDYVWPGESVARGSIPSRATVIAWDLGPCRGQLAYRRISWFFPAYGDTFDPSQWIDPCTGAYAPYKPPRNCADVTIRSPHGYASQVQVYGISCSRAREIISTSPSVRYVTFGESRFRHAGLYCGTEGYSDLSPPTLFDCARGRVSIFYAVS